MTYAHRHTYTQTHIRMCKASRWLVLLLLAVILGRIVSCVEVYR